MPPSASTAVTDRPPKLGIKLRVGQAFIEVVKCESLRDKWLTASCLLRMIKQRYGFRDDASDFSVLMLNRAILKVAYGTTLHFSSFTLWRTSRSGKRKLCQGTKFQTIGKTRKRKLFFVRNLARRLKMLLTEDARRSIK
jgi:hypothetical protein